jgi:hypothetical protein
LQPSLNLAWTKEEKANHLVKLKPQMPLLKDDVFATKHPGPFFQNRMHILFSVEPKDYKTISSGCDMF